MAYRRDRCFYCQRPADVTGYISSRGSCEDCAVAKATREARIAFRLAADLPRERNADGSTTIQQGVQRSATYMRARHDLAHGLHKLY